MKCKRLASGTASTLAMLVIASLIAGCGNFWKASTTATTTTLAASTSTPVVGASVTLTATVSPTAATGTVTFYDGTASLGTATLSSGTGTLSTSFSTTGTHSITATYEGSTTYATSTSSTVTLTCTSSSLTSTTTTLAASTTTPTISQDVTLTATVASSEATGTVAFYEGSTSLGNSTLSSGTASLTTSFSTAGTYSLTAVYSGDSTYATSTSSVVNVTVTSSSSLTSTATTLASSTYSTTSETAFTLTATVAIASTGDTATAATGTVDFYDTTTSTELGTGSLSSGTATLSTSLSTTGTHVIDAIYGGDSSYATSTSSTISVVIASSSSSSSTIMLSVSPTTVTYGTGVALAAIVTPVSSTGTVTFYDGSTEIGTADLASGSAVAALTTTSLAVGSHTITAKYSSLTSSSTAVTVTTASAGSFTSAAACGYATDGATGAEVLSTGTLITSDQSYSTSRADQNAICVTGTKSYLTLIDPTISSSSVTTVDGDSSWYGLDAAVLDYNGGDITIDGGAITTSGSGGNMLYSYGTGTITISNATLSSTTTSTSNNHGIYAAGAGTIVANNVTASSAGASSSIVATDNGGGSVTINGGTYKTTGGKSAGIYSTGSITAYNGTFTSTIAEAVVIEGANLVKLYNSTLNAGSDGSSNSKATHRGVFLYQSNSGDATNTSCNAGDCFYMTNGTLNFTDMTSSSSDPSDNCSAFAVYNQSSVITLTDVAINNSCGTLLLAGYNDNWSNADAWGYATLKSYGTTLTGNIVIGGTCLTTACITRDSTSTGAIYLYEDTAGTGSTLTGEINNADTGKTVSLTIDATSKWVVTGTSYLTSVTDADTTYSNIICATAGCQVYNGTTLISPAAN